MILEYYLPKGVAVSLAYPAYDGEWSSQYVTAPADLDSEVSKDKGNYADCTNEWTEIQTSGTGTLDLTATEMTADLVIVKTTSSTTGVNFPLIVIHTYTDPLDIANTELTSVPANTASLRQMQQYTFGNTLNKRVQNKTTGEETLYKSNGSDALGTRTNSADDTTVTRGAMS